MVADVISFKPAAPVKRKCAFCQKTEDQVARMMQSELGPCICNECVAVCNQRLEEANETKAS